jgi:hypothetical protein
VHDISKPRVIGTQCLLDQLELALLMLQERHGAPDGTQAGQDALVGVRVTGLAI